MIGDTVRQVLREWDPPPLEVIVADGGSTDGWVASAKRDEGSGVRCSETWTARWGRRVWLGKRSKRSMGAALA